ncbi:MAG: Hsp20/alpha crystallin family protein [Tunicatimonas sp.]
MKNVLKDFVRQIDAINTITGGTVATMVNVKKKTDKLVIQVNAPSVNSDSFNIYVHGNQLVVYTTLNDTPLTLDEDGEEQSSRHTTPIFNRTFSLPPAVDKDQIDAVFERGQLKILLPFGADNDVPAKRIDIREY